MNDDNEALVERLDDRIDGIEGLITLKAFDGRILALVENAEHSERVRVELEALGVPNDVLDMLPVDQYLIPYPTDDLRLTLPGDTR